MQAVWCELYVAAEAKLSLMPKAQSILYPASFVVLFLVCATFLWPLGGGRVSAVEMPDLRSAPEPYVAVSNIYVAPDPPDISIGGLESISRTVLQRVMASASTVIHDPMAGSAHDDSQVQMGHPRAHLRLL